MSLYHGHYFPDNIVRSTASTWAILSNLFILPPLSGSHRLAHNSVSQALQVTWLGGGRGTPIDLGFRKVRLQDIYTRPDLQRVVIWGPQTHPHWGQKNPSCLFSQQVAVDKKAAAV